MMGAMADDPGGSTARSSVTVAVWTLVSRAAGMVRVLVIGALLGPTYFTNVFQASYVLPNQVFTVMAGPVVGMVVVPSVVRAVAAGGAQHASLLMGRISGRMMALAGIGALGLALLSPALAWSLVFGIPEPERQRAWLLCILLILFVAPQVLLYVLAELGVAAQQGRHRFALAAGAPAVESVGTVLTLAVTASVYGVGLEVAQVPLSMIIMLGVGTTVSALLHAGLQVYGARRVGVSLRPTRGWRDDTEARDTLRRMVRSSPVAASQALTDYFLTVVAATVPGGVLVVNLAYQVFSALSFVGTRAVSMAALPGLSVAAAANDPRRFGVSWRQGVFYALLAGIPLCALLAVFSGQTADLLAVGKLSEGPLIAELSACLLIAAFAQLVSGIHDFARQALFSRLDDRGPTLASMIALGTGTLVTAATMLLPADGTRLTGLLVALLAGEFAAAMTALSRLRAMMRPEPMIDRRDAGVIVAATTAMLPMLAAGWWLMSTLDTTGGVQLVLLIGCGLATLVPYGAVLYFASVLPDVRPRRSRRVCRR